MNWLLIIKDVIIICFMSVSTSYILHSFLLRLKTNLKNQRKYMVVQHTTTKEIFFLQAYNDNTFDKMMEVNDLSECKVLAQGYFNPCIKVGGE